MNTRILSVLGFSFFFTYILSFLFEGQVLYDLLNTYKAENSDYIINIILSHFLGLFICGFFIKSSKAAKQTMLLGMSICLLTIIPMFFLIPWLWKLGLILSGFISGFIVASWGYFLKTFTPKNKRIKSCADVLIYSNILMIIINIITARTSPTIGLMLIAFCIFIGLMIIIKLSFENKTTSDEKTKKILSENFKKSLQLLFLFITIISVNAGLMYQIVNPAFEHLGELIRWYWAIPYIIALIIMRNLPRKIKRAKFLYVSIIMMIGGFISFMLLGRSSFDYLVINTLILGACGILDLFWWSILGEMLDYTDNPIKTFGIGLSANVFGILCGGIFGLNITSIQLSSTEIALIALIIVCLTLTLLPVLNQQLIILLKDHVYLTTYSNMNKQQQNMIINQIEISASLTKREKDVLPYLLNGKSNKIIAENLFISENTVKTHTRNIYSKYNVNNRMELIKNILKNEI